MIRWIAGWREQEGRILNRLDNVYAIAS